MLLRVVVLLGVKYRVPFLMAFESLSVSLTRMFCMVLVRYAQYMDNSDSSHQRLARASLSTLIKEYKPEENETVSGT
jgi:hypothetical protein